MVPYRFNLHSVTDSLECPRMKKCFKCDQDKDLSEFYKHPKMTDGHLGKCKECTKTDTAKRHAEKFDDPAWRVAELKRHRTKSAKYRMEGRAPKPSIRASFDWLKKNPEKRKAHNLVSSAIQLGKMKKQPCEVCGEARSQAHHDDYSKPLEVRWLCPKHHGEHHHNENVARILKENQ